MRPLNNEKPLLIQPKLADKIGLSECIILSQLHYWLEINKENNVNFHDGNYWVFHTISQWEKQFPFWCEKTIRNTFKSLEKQNLIKTGNYNKHRYDRTKWYTILYDNIPEIENDSLSNSVKSQTITEHSTIP